MLPASRYGSSLSGFSCAASFRRAYAVRGAVVQIRAALCTSSWLSHGAQRERRSAAPRRARRATPARRPAREPPRARAPAISPAPAGTRRRATACAGRAHRRSRAERTRARRGRRTPRTSRTSRAQASTQSRPALPRRPPRASGSGDRSGRHGRRSSAATRPTSASSAPDQPGLRERPQLDAVRVARGLAAAPVRQVLLLEVVRADPEQRMGAELVERDAVEVVAVAPQPADSRLPVCSLRTRP